MNMDARKVNASLSRLHRNLLPRKVSKDRFILLQTSASKSTRRAACCFGLLTLLGHKL